MNVWLRSASAAAHLLHVPHAALQEADRLKPMAYADTAALLYKVEETHRLYKQLLFESKSQSPHFINRRQQGLQLNQASKPGDRRVI